MLEFIPEARREVAAAALSAVFGATAVDLRPVTGGASGALTFRAEAGGRVCLLRMEGAPNPMRNPHQYACMEMAARAGVAPPLHHVDAAAGVAVMDFIAEQPLDAFPGGPMALARETGRMIADLQTVAEFPASPYRYPDLISHFFGTMLAGGGFSAGLLAPHAEAFAALKAAYPWDAEPTVASHNDPNPRNILFDGTRLWLIDWETSYRNDPLVDVAILADTFALTPELEAELMQAWLGRGPDSRTTARLTLMRALTRLYYASLLLGMLAPYSADAPETDLTPIAWPDFHAGIRDGTLPAGSPQMLRALGKAQLARFLDAVRAPGFDAALAICGKAG